MNPEERIQRLEQEVEDLRYALNRKTGGGSADIKGNIISPSTLGGSYPAGSVDQTAIGAGAVGQSELKYEQVSVTVTAGNPSGTATVTSGSIIVGWRATGNQDQLIDNMAVSGTTLTITLAANATANNTFEVILLKV